MQNWWMALSEPERVGLIIAGSALLVILFYYFFFFLRIAFHKNKVEDPVSWPSISVIICARNEEQNIIDLLPKILNQKYPGQFEVVVVNDDSWDGTGDELAEMEKTNEHLRVVTIKEHMQHRPGKKFPLTLGIKKAAYDHFLLTDADCFPASDLWIEHMARSFGDKQIVLAPGPYVTEKGLLNALIRFENLLTGTFFLSFAMAGKPYMGVGRNLAYTRDVYDSVGGFKSHYHVVSGDDDLFIRDAGTNRNTAVCIHPEALTFSQPALNWNDWWRQKKRHYSTSSYYRFSTKALLFLYPMANVVFLVVTIALLVYENTRHISLAVLGGKVLLQIIIFRLVFNVQNDRFLWLFSPLLELVLLLNQAVLGIIGVLSKQSRWK